MLFQCWPTVKDGRPTLKQHWADAPSLLGANVNYTPIYIQTCNNTVPSSTFLPPFTILTGNILFSIAWRKAMQVWKFSNQILNIYTQMTRTMCDSDIEAENW